MITTRFTSSIAAYKPVLKKYPNSYAGCHRLAFRFRLPLVKYDTVLRLSWYGRYTESDWRHVDPYKRINIAPSYAKWFSFVQYYAGMFRNMYHLDIGKFGLSIIPLTHGDCRWWD